MWQWVTHSSLNLQILFWFSQIFNFRINTILCHNDPDLFSNLNNDISVSVFDHTMKILIIANFFSDNNDIKVKAFKYNVSITELNL